MQNGIALTRQGNFTEAIPRFLAAQGHVRDEYAADFNLALCYVATGQPSRAIEILSALKNHGNANAEVNNLLAQAYIGMGQEKPALAAFRQAVAQTPEDEKLYLFLADACMDHESYDLGLQILRAGLQHLPRSGLIHYERGVFFTFENQPDAAEEEFHAAENLEPKSDVFYMAAGQAALLEGNVPEAVRVTREGVRAGYQNFILLALFGTAAGDSGVAPDRPLFAEAEAALEKSVNEHPSNAGAQVALAKLYLRANRVADAIAHLEIARKLAPSDPAVYSHLAIAYRRQGEAAKAQEALGILAKLDADQAAKYKTDSPNKAGYVAAGRTARKSPQQQ
ncbi:MAG TPA: tetratricopeptide repeat protein [Candidatus Acidoferrales bacterium]|nr:tetratricopeptide repeat protein [Candidatus Acidoferrales bacterium]